MSNSFVLSGLVTKYSELAGELDNMRREIRNLENDLTNISTTIKIFDPGYPISQIKSKKTVKRIPGLKNGDTFKMALEILKDSRKPLMVSEIAAIMLDKLVIPLDDTDQARLRKRAESTVKRLQAKGMVKEVASIGPKSMALFELNRQTG